MKETVTAVITSQQSLFLIKRQGFLKDYPGFHSFPGGKVDEVDYEKTASKELVNLNSSISSHLLNAVEREVFEELSIVLSDFAKLGLIKSLQIVGRSVTPYYSCSQFNNYYINIEFKEKVSSFKINPNEISNAWWDQSSNIYQQYLEGKILIVPPSLEVILLHSQSVLTTRCVYSFPKEELDKVPIVEFIHGVSICMPLSNTFPPSYRTNCVILGDEEKIAIDPSPKNNEEVIKFINTVESLKIDSILISHYHPDHHEYSVDIAKTLKVKMLMSKKTHELILLNFGGNYFDDVDVSFISDGDIITKYLNDEVYTIETPGHASGQVSFASKSLNFCFVGDLIQTIGTVVIGGSNGDMQQYCDSLREIINLNPRVIIPSHGMPVGEINRLEETLEHRLKREKQVIELLKQGYTINEITDRIYFNISIKLRPYAFKTVEAHIIKIKKEGLIH